MNRGLKNLVTPQAPNKANSLPTYVNSFESSLIFYLQKNECQQVFLRHIRIQTKRIFIKKKQYTFGIFDYYNRTIRIPTQKQFEQEHKHRNTLKHIHLDTNQHSKRQ